MKTPSMPSAGGSVRQDDNSAAERPASEWRQQLESFRRFYRGLPDRRDPFYMFFTSGLLQFAAHAAAQAPERVNLVLIGAGLTAEEQRWVERHLRRPFHHISTRTDDKAVWELLFCVNGGHFGWLDVDCFVANPDLFREMAVVAPDTAINCTWSYRGPGGLDILRTYFLFLNADAIRAVRRVIPVSPAPYSYERMARDRVHPWRYTRRLGAAHIERLRLVLPDADGRLAYPRDPGGRFEYHGFDTLVVYQLIATTLGYRLHKIRNLSGVSGDRAAYSSELFHVGAVAAYKSFRDERDPLFRYFYSMILQLDYMLLSVEGRDLPASYDALRDEARSELDRLGITPDGARRTVRRFLTSAGAPARMRP